MTKKGQDLTKPGEKDDFMDILRKQQEELRAKYEKQSKERHPERKGRGEPATDAGK